MLQLGYALAETGLVTEKSVQAYKVRHNLEETVRSALKKAQRTGKSSDWKKYSSLRKRLPRGLRQNF